MQVTFSGIGGRTALVPQKNGVRTPSWAFNSNLKFTCKMSLDAMQDVRVNETPITRPLTWEDEQPAAAPMAGNLNYTSNASATLAGLPVPVMSLKTCNGAPGQFKNGFYFTVSSEVHGKCLLIAYLHLGGLLVRPSVKSFNKNNAVLVHTEMCGYDTHSVSVDIKIPETSSIHKAGPRYSSTHPPFCIKFILWGQDGLIKTMHESMPLYSYAKDPDQVNCQYFSPNPGAPTLPSPSPSATRERTLHRGLHESPPPSPPQLTPTNLLANTPSMTQNSPNITSPLASLSSTFVMGSTAAAISIPMDSFKSLVAYIQKLERQVEVQQQQLDSGRQQDELQHRMISQLAQDVKFKSFQCEVLEEKLQQLSATHPTHAHTQAQTPTGDNLIAPGHLISLNPIVNSASNSSTHLSPFAYPSTPSAATNSSTTNNALPAFSYPTSNAHSSTLNPINHLSMPLSSPLGAPLLITNPLTANLATTDGTHMHAKMDGDHSMASATTATTTSTTSAGLISPPSHPIHMAAPISTISSTPPHILSPIAQVDATHTAPDANMHATQTHESAQERKVLGANGEATNSDARIGTEREAAEPMKEQQEQEVRDFLTQMQKKQKGEGIDDSEDLKRQRTL